MAPWRPLCGRTLAWLATAGVLGLWLLPGSISLTAHDEAQPGAAGAAVTAPWTPDTGDGSFRNPVIYADYSDPDVVRVGDDFYLVASSFQHVPGLPILHSTDLVNWTLVGHAAERLPSPTYDTPQHGKGLWAPSIRFHAGYYWIYVGDPDLGVFMTRARDPRGPWEPLHLVKSARGWIDTCPLWDDDGKVYLVHAWANSRVGFNSVLHVARLSDDGRQVVDDGPQVFDGHALHPTMEGPKFYKRNGYYYIFAPAGGVKPGWQTVLRSRNVFGPYDDRIVLDQGRTRVNGPHQGGWVDTPSGEDWFVHFQDVGAHGRIVHLQPMVWKDDWPVIGEDPDGDGRGQPVLTFRKPTVNAPSKVLVPQTSDEFATPRLGLQWQWHANPSATWWSLTAKKGALRLVPESREPGLLWNQSSLLLQKFPAEQFAATAELTVNATRAGSRSGLVVMGRDYAFVAVERTLDGWQVVVVTNKNADKGGQEVAQATAPLPSGQAWLRANVGPAARTTFSYSTDGKNFSPLGEVFAAREGVWVGARVGLFTAPLTGDARGHTDVEWFRVE